MKTKLFLLICLSATVYAAPVFAQEAEMPQVNPEQQAESLKAKAEQQAESLKMQAEQQAEMPQMEPEQQAEIPQMEPEQQVEMPQIEPEQQAEMPQIEPEPQAEMPQMEPEPQAESLEMKAEQQAESLEMKAEQQAETPQMEPEQQAEMPQMTPEQQAEMAAYMKAGALGPQHEFLATHVGTFDVAMKSWMDPAAPPMESKGSAVRTLHMGGRILHEEFQGDMMGTPFTGLSRSGYDNVSGKWWSTWTDSMSTGIMFSEGDCDENHTCTYIGTYNDPVKGGPVTNRYVVKTISADEQHFEMYGTGRDGSEVKMMEMVYTRR